jgi:fucose permease
MIGAAYGPLLELLARRFALALPTAGLAIDVHFAGALVGTLAAMVALKRASGRLMIMSGSAILGAGCAAVAAAPAWISFLAGVFVVGMGWGALVICLNQVVAFSEGTRRTALLNALNGAFSAGAVASPILISNFAAAHLALLYGGAAAVALAVIPFANGVSGRLPMGRGEPDARAGTLVAAFVLAFALYVAVEAGTGGWMTSHLESSGIRSRDAATFTSGFFLALAAGRLLFTLVPASVPEPVVVLTGCAGAVLTLGAAAFSGFAPWAYIATGLVIAPIFPTAVAWLARTARGDASATSWVFPAVAVGGIAGPGTVGVVIAHFGLSWTPLVLSGAALATLGAFLIARRQIAAATPVEVLGP